MSEPTRQETTSGGAASGGAASGGATSGGAASGGAAASATLPSESDDHEEEFGTVLVKSGPRRHDGESDKAYTARCKKEQGKKAAKEGKGKGGKGRR